MKIKNIYEKGFGNNNITLMLGKKAIQMNHIKIKICNEVKEY